MDPLRPVPISKKKLRALEGKAPSREHPSAEGGAAHGPAAPGDAVSQRRRELAMLLWGEPEEDDLFMDLLTGRRPGDAETQPGTPMEQLPEEMGDFELKGLPEEHPDDHLPEVEDSRLPAAHAPGLRPDETHFPPASDIRLAEPVEAAAAEDSEQDFHHGSENLSHVESTATRGTFRRRCCFPGLVRVLIPEESLQPRLMAVRVIDLSPSGARLETRQLTPDLEQTLRAERRFCRLEAVAPRDRRLVIPGRIIWARHGEEMSTLGVHFIKRCGDVEDVFLSEVAGETTPEALTLASPQLAAFSTLTNATQIAFSGQAPGAERVEVRRRHERFEARVEDGGFSVDVPLEPETSNFFSFVALAPDGRASIPTPVCVMQTADATGSENFAPAALVEAFDVDPEDDRVFICLDGPASRFASIFARLAAALDHAEEVHLEVELRGHAAEVAGVLGDPRRILKK